MNFLFLGGLDIRDTYFWTFVSDLETRDLDIYPRTYFGFEDCRTI